MAHWQYIEIIPLDNLVQFNFTCYLVYLSKTITPHQEYREFAPGAGYILGRDLVPRVLTYSSHVVLTSAEDVYMGEVVGQLGVQITPLTGVYPIWQEFCNQAEEEGVTPQWTVIHWLDPPRMVNSIFSLLFG